MGMSWQEQRSPVTALDTRPDASCPRNSILSDCASACPATCVEPAAPDSCSLPCVRGCACARGFILNRGACVPREQCECRHEGKRYPAGAAFWADAACTTRCACPSPGSPPVCTRASCPKASSCGVRAGVRGCHSRGHGVCRVHGDPHYSTFDLASHHFLGNCTYVLAKACGAPAALPRFLVAAKNEFLENPPRAFVHKVFVEVYGDLIEIQKGNAYQVLVDEMWRTLPARNANGSIFMSRSGRYISIETDFSLIVNYDADHLVEVRLPATFSNMTCGLCGNFNGRKEDDAMMPNGQQANSSMELGNSWRMPHGKYDHPFCGTPDIQPLCTTEEEDIYRENEFCGLLTNTEGPFHECHATISPEAFFDSCLRDMCAFNGNQKLLCNTLGAYSEACQRSGILLANWRVDTFCLFLCPSNSEHNMCTSACPATCANPLAPHNCSKPCVEGCQCHEGYVFSGGECVLAKDCGCLDEDKYHEKGETFWRAGCAGQCLCAENGTLVCNSDTCPEDQICKVEEGILGCHIPDVAACHIFGDPHYITFNRRLYHFQGGCNYTMVETFGQLLQHFSVTVRNERQEHQGMTILNSVAFSYRNLHIALRKKKEVYVNGVKVRVPKKLDHEIILEEKHNMVAINSPFGLRVEFDGDQNIFIQVNEKYKEHLRGLCGVYSGDRSDELMQPNGLVEEDSNVFANSWMVKDEGWSCDPQTTVPVNCSSSSKKRHKAVCNVIADEEGPFRSCHSQIPPSNYVASCVHDQCASQGSRGYCRKSMEAYVAACGRFGIDLGDWWTKTLCEPVTRCSFSCPFDTDLCLWTQSATDHFDWTRFKGSTPSQMTGPTQDHTTGEGYYLYLEGDNVIEGNVAHLVSPTCNSSGPFCFNFWYHMFGSASLMSLRVYVMPEGKEAALIWVATGRKQNKWLQASVTVPNAGRLKVIVEGVRGEDFHSDVAIDDFSMSEGSCTEEKEQSSEVPQSGEEKEDDALPDALLKELFQQQQSKFKADLAAALEPIKTQLTSLTEEMAVIKESTEEAFNMGVSPEKEMTELQDSTADFQKEIEDLENQHRKLIVRFHSMPDAAEEESVISFLVDFLNKICPEVHVSEEDFERVSNSLVPKLQQQEMPREVVARVGRLSRRALFLQKLKALPSIEYGSSKISVYQGLPMKTLPKRRLFRPYAGKPEAGGIHYREGFPFRLFVRHNGRNFVVTTQDEAAAVCDSLEAAVQEQGRP